LLLRFNITRGYSTGYECNFSMAGNPNGPYAQIVRWDGVIGDFAPLTGQNINQIADGDIVSATMVGNTITGYINGEAVLSYDTSGDAVSYTTGSPGLGFYLQGTGTNDSGFTQFLAYDDAGPMVILEPAFANGQFSFLFPTVAGQSYTVQRNDDLGTTNWIPFTNSIGTGLPFQLAISTTNPVSSSYFRVRQP
jgi:hypothetical protein